jgi:hypothetical protein
MKSLVWLLLLAFGTATAQVQPVDVRLTAEEKCCCCADGANACDMASDCAPAPTSCAQPAVSLQSPVLAVAKRAVSAPQAAREKFYVQFLPRVRVAPALPVTGVVAPAASVPRFQEHCSFLI